MQAFACDMSEHVGTGMGAALTLALIGTVNGRWHPWLLVEAGAALVTGGPTCVVLAGALKPEGVCGVFGVTDICVAMADTAAADADVFDAVIVLSPRAMSSRLHAPTLCAPPRPLPRDSPAWCSPGG